LAPSERCSAFRGISRAAIYCGTIVVVTDSEQPTSETAPSEQFRIRFADGREFGPAPMERVCQWARDGRVPKDAELVKVSDGTATPVMAVPMIASILNVPSTSAVAPTQSVGDDSMATIIPYRNPPALAGYYVSIFSLLPIVGALLGPTAIVLGIIGLRKLKAEPESKGVVHAWIAIVLGTVGLLISATCVSALLFSRWV
jgi:hypothetical protein